MSVQKKVLKSNNLDKFLYVYYNEVHVLPVREYAQKSGISKSSVSTYLSSCKDQGLLHDTLPFKLHKSLFEVKRIVTSGLIEHIVEKMQPSAIILFGSVQKGEYVYSSDVDIFIESYEKEVNVSSFVKKLNRDIQLFIYPSIAKVPKDLRQNIINGFTLYGGVST